MGLSSGGFKALGLGFRVASIGMYDLARAAGVPTSARVIEKKIHTHSFVSCSNVHRSV